MFGSQKNLLTHIACNPQVRVTVDSLFCSSYEVITYHPLKEFDDTYTMTVQNNKSVQITFDFCKNLSRNFLVNGKQFDIRQVYLVDEATVVLKKGKTHLVLDQETRDCISFFLAELIYAYTKEVNDILSEKEDSAVITMNKSKVLALCKDEFMNVVNAETQAESIRELTKHSMRVFDLIPEAESFYKKWIRGKNIPRHLQIKTLMKSKRISRFFKRKFH